MLKYVIFNLLTNSHIFPVRKLGDLTLALGKQIAPHIKEQGSRLLSTALNKDQKETDQTMDGVLTVAAGGLQGIAFCVL